MKLLASLVATMGLGFAASVLASPIVELKDGSRIQGEIQSIQNGEYTIVSPSLGTVRVAQSNIARISYVGTAATGDSAGNEIGASAEIAAQAQQLAQDPAAMQSILSLQSDPQIQALLKDPQIMQAIARGDYASLMKNPKIQALDNNAQLKNVMRGLGQ